MMGKKQCTIGYSPCPNDTYIFYGLVHGKVPLTKFSLAKPVLEDVETLNQWALHGHLDITKLSFHALGHVLEDYALLHSGAALGRGCGPLLITGKKTKQSEISSWRIAIPGALTTAALLLKLYAPKCMNVHVMRFEQIMDAVANGQVDAGVIIHESRFTYQQYDLQCVQDLGEWWEQKTGLPIPLGCIAAKRTLGKAVINEIDQSIKKSLQWTRQTPDASKNYITTYAQELDEKVTQCHIDLYVNSFSLHLGDEGVAAIEELLGRGAEAGIFPSSVRKRNNLFTP